MSYIYLACPYSDPDPDVRERRFLASRRVAAIFTICKIPIYAPIVHGHCIDVEIESHAWDPATAHDLWMNQCEAMLVSADALAILQLPGYSISRGVGLEIEIARDCSIPIFELNPVRFQGDLHEACLYAISSYSVVQAAQGIRTPENDGTDGVNPPPRPASPDRSPE